MIQEKPIFILRPPPLIRFLSVAGFVGLSYFATLTWRESVIGTVLLVIILLFVWLPTLVTIKIVVWPDGFQLVSSYALLPNLRKLIRIKYRFSNISSITVERTTPFISEGPDIRQITWRDRVIIPGAITLPGLYFHKLEKLIEFAKQANPNIQISTSRTTIWSNLSQMT